jgi:6-phosphogluconolactonase
MKATLAGLIAGLLIGISSGGAGQDTPTAATKERVYLGTYTNKGSEGIYVAEFDAATGQLGEAKLAVKTSNPSFLALHPNRRYLYAVNEDNTFAGKPGGGVSAFAIDAQTGLLTLINTQRSMGPSPCHLSVTRAGRVLCVANYGNGQVVGLPIKDDGSLEPPTGAIRIEGKGPNKDRQEGPHAHSITVSPDDQYAAFADLGVDLVALLKLGERGTLQLSPGGMIHVPPGGGPRHLAFHPQQGFAYVNNELTSTVSVLKYDAKHGTLDIIETVSTLPKDFHGQSGTAEIQVHPNGKFLYVSNRGHDSVAVFRIQANGTLQPLDHVPTGGKTPRNFCIHPSGKYLLAANQDSNNVVVFRIDPAQGIPKPTGQSIHVTTPVCVRFAK